jgi:hypothetical protein
VDFVQLAAALGLERGEAEGEGESAGGPGQAALAALAAEWAASQVTRPAGEVFFLQPAYVTAAGRGAYLPADLTAAAAAAADHVAAEAPWRALAWHCHYCLYRSPAYAAYPALPIRRWPVLRGAGGVSHWDAGLFYLVVLLSGMPETRSVYLARGIPEVVARAS